MVDPLSNLVDDEQRPVVALIYLWSIIHFHDYFLLVRPTVLTLLSTLFQNNSILQRSASLNVIFFFIFWPSALDYYPAYRYKFWLINWKSRGISILGSDNVRSSLFLILYNAQVPKYETQSQTKTKLTQ